MTYQITSFDQRIESFNQTFKQITPIGPAVYFEVELDDDDILNEIIFITPFWKITRMYTDSLPSQIQEMNFEKLDKNFNHRFRY